MSLVYPTCEIPPSQTPPVPQSHSVTIDLAKHVEWAVGRAVEVARRYRFAPHGQEELDLVQVAHLTLARLARTFDPRFVPRGGDPDGAFRGWAAIHVRSECTREARRLRNGGTYRTRREKRGIAIVAAPLSDFTGDEPFDIPDDIPYDPLDDAPPDERPLPPVHEPGTYGRRLAGRRY